LSENVLTTLAILYHSRIDEAVPDRSLFFVSDVLGSMVSDTGLCRIFNLVWKATEFAEFADRKPTIHSFRHTFVVRRLEDWYTKKVDYTYWLPYLSAHLGHSSLNATYDYIHLVDWVVNIFSDNLLRHFC
jgi:integrase/recombinase XerD